MDDLVKRLRKHGGNGFAIGYEAAAEIERLKVALDDHYDSAWDKIALLTKSLGEMTKERDELRGQVEALRADAERWRWLRMFSNPVVFGRTWPMGDRKELDAAIDAAMKAGE